MANDVVLVLRNVTNVDALAAVVVRAADGDAGVAAVGAPAAATHTTTGGLRTSSASSPTTLRSILTTSPSPTRSSPAWCAPLRVTQKWLPPRRPRRRRLGRPTACAARRRRGRRRCARGRHRDERRSGRGLRRARRRRRRCYSCHSVRRGGDVQGDRRIALLVGAVADRVALVLHDVTDAVAVKGGVACATEGNTAVGAIAQIVEATLKACAVFFCTLTSSRTAVHLSLLTLTSPLSWASLAATEVSPPLRRPRRRRSRRRLLCAASRRLCLGRRGGHV